MTATTIGEALAARLAATSAVSALVGSRIFAVTAPAGTAHPFLTYQEISALDPAATLDGPSVWLRARYQVDAWADRQDQAEALGRAVRAALDGYSGGAGDAIVKSCLFADRRWLHEQAEQLHRCSIDFIIWAQE